jgi:predicted RNA-binding protein with PUA domain
MIKQILLGTVFVILVLSEGCQQNHLTRTDIDASSIPDQTYEVTVHTRFMSRDYAVLFDIPDDGVEVFMRHTSSTQRTGVRHTASTEKTGRDSPRRYIDEFQDRIKHYRTVSIADKDGTVRGYLMVSSALNYWISPAGERIMVRIERDSSYNYRLP